jgi:uncharacterized protein with HEPN domain
LTEFAADVKTRDATERCLEPISEAASKLASMAEELMPNQPWRDIRAFGNVLRHQYDDIVDSRIWNTIQTGLSSLERDCTEALRRLSDSK